MHCSLPHVALLTLPDPPVEPAPSASSLPAQRQGKGPVELLVWFAVYAYVAMLVIRTSFDPDIWWHLRTGQWIVGHMALPATDPFSSFGQGRPWVAYSWLFEVSIYALHRAFGLFGIVLYRVALAFALAVLIHRMVARREPRFLRGRTG